MSLVLVVLLAWALLSALTVAGLAALFTGSERWRRRAAREAAALASSRRDTVRHLPLAG